MATAKKADIKIKSTNFTGDDGKLIYPRAHHDHIDGKPTSYPPTAHTHTISEIEGFTIPSIPSVMNTTEGNTGTATTQRTINAANLKSIILNHSPAGSRPSTWGDVSGKPTWIDSSKPSYTASEVGAAPTSHSHSVATTSTSGFLSAADKTKLNGLSNYTHPSYTAMTRIATGIDVMDTFISDATGHVTAVAYRELPFATTTEAGVMSASDKTKLNGLSNYTHPSYIPQELEATGFEIIDTIFSDSTGHLTQVSTRELNTATTSSAGLMSSSDKTKLNGIAAGAEVNVQSNWNATSGDAFILNKPTIPTNNNQLTNGAGYITGYTETDPIFTAWNKSTGISITKSQVSDLIEATQSLSGLMSATDKTRLDVLYSLLEEDTANNVVDSINEVLEIFNNYPEGADLVTALANKVDKVTGKGLSTNDYTTTEKNKLAGIASGAQVNVGTNLSQGARNTTTLRIDSSTGNNLTLPAVTTSLAGLMTSTDKTKLNGLSNYTHPSYTAMTRIATGIDVMDTFISDATGHVTAVAYRELPFATTTEAGVMSASDKTKLNGLSNYTHPSYIPQELEATGFEIIDTIFSDSTGHLTQVSTRELNTATTSSAGLMSSSDKTKLNGIATNATANLGTVTNVSSGTQVSGLTLSVTNGTTTPTITTSISNAANFRSAIGAGTGSSNLTIGTTASTAKAGNYHPTWSQVTSKPSWIGASKPTYTASEVGAAAASHTHDDRYYTETEVNTLLNGKSSTSHTHSTATTSAAGFMSGADKTKLNGLSNYTHPSYTAQNIEASGMEVIDTFITNATGHVIDISTRDLPNASTSSYGVARLATTSEGQAGTNNTTIMTPLRVKEAINASGGTYTLTKAKIDTALAGAGSDSIQLGDYANASGSESTAFGKDTTASGNVAIAVGYEASAGGSYSTAVGSYSAASKTYSTSFGSEANASGENSTAIGSLAYTGGDSSIALGMEASTSREYATVIGAAAYVSGNYSVALGASASAGGNYSTALGSDAATGASSNLMQLGSSGNLSTLRSRVQLTVTSDIRDKADIEEVPTALDFIKDLNPITYVSNDRDNYISKEQKETDTYKDYLMVKDYDKTSHSQGTKKGSRRRVGLSAQEVRDKLIEHYGSDNYANVVNDNFVEFEERDLDIPKGLENKLTMSYETMVPFLIKAIQEQQEQIEELKMIINERS